MSGEMLARFRGGAEVRSVGGLIDSVATTAQLADIDRILPDEWRPGAVGDAATCARRWLKEFEAGADGLTKRAPKSEPSKRHGV